MPGPVLHARGAGPASAAADERSASRPPGELAFLIDPVGPGTRALCALEPRRPDRTSSARSATASGSTSPRPLLVGGGDRHRAAAVPRRGARPPAGGARLPQRARTPRRPSLLPGAEVVVDPVLVTELLPGRAATCSRAGRSRCCAPSRALPRRAARMGGADGLRLRRLLRLRRRDRRRAEAALRRRARCLACCLLNASGCLDALTAPEDARAGSTRSSTKTVTPCRARATRRSAIAETDARDAQRDRAREPGPRARSSRAPAAPARARRARSGSRSAASAAADYADTCAALDGRRGDRAQPLLPERRRGARVGRRDRRRLPRRDVAAALREALAGHPDIAAVARAVEAAGADGLSLVNTIRGLALDRARCDPCSRAAPAGYSGPALKPIALAAVHACRAATQLPIVGMGGVASGQRRDRARSPAARAHVALGTVLFSDPGCAGAYPARAARRSRRSVSTRTENARRATRTVDA